MRRQEGRAGMPAARRRILDPFAQDSGHLLVRTIGLALIDIGRSMIVPQRRSVISKADVGTGDSDARCRHSARRIDHAVHRIALGEGDLDLGSIAAFADEIQAVVKELPAEQDKPICSREKRRGWSHRERIRRSGIHRRL